MTANEQSAGARVRIFDDAHSAAGALRGLEVGVLIEEHPFGEWMTWEADLGSAGILQRSQTAGALAATTALHPDICSIVVPCVDSPDALSIDGHALTPGRVAFVSGGRHLLNAQGSTTWIAMRLARAELRQHFPRRIASTRAMHMVYVGLDRHWRLQQVLEDALETALRHPSRVATASGRERFRQCVTQIVRSYVDDTPGEGRGGQRALVCQLANYLAKHRGEPLFVPELCHALGIKPRALRLAFAALFGMSPARFLRLRRLHAAHRDLRNAQRPSSVTEVGIRHGFFDLGRFASEYRATFGELPSSTLARTRGVQ